MGNKIALQKREGGSEKCDYCVIAGESNNKQVHAVDALLGTTPVRNQL